MRKRNNVITLEDRIPKLKEQRKQKANRRMILYVSMFFVLVLVIVYFVSPLGHVGKIAVSGNHFVSREEILEASGLSANAGFWEMDADTIANHIEQMKQIKLAEVERRFPNRFSIKVTEYHRVAYLEANGHFYPILGNGARLSALDESEIPADAPVLAGWEEGKMLSAMAAQLTKLPMPIVRGISEIHWTPTEHFPKAITAYMNDGFVVKALIQDFADKMEQYPRIISELDPNTKGVIHMRVGTYFVKYADEEESSDDN
ncbi:MAG TPA: cell division protein FtsQ/DivIB [Bacillales bacterium]|nr:cell division protein FtsQ/DivIB [Bacillales bacterium]